MSPPTNGNVAVTSRPESAEEHARGRFEHDTRNFRMTVLHDDGVYRHIRFMGRGGSFYYFDLITWPGYLTICGDCETYTFRRLPDMFEFFRPERDSINPYYWGEKIQCPGGRDALKVYSEDLFRARVAQEVDEWCEDRDPDLAATLREEVKAQVLDAEEISWDRGSAMGVLASFYAHGTGFTFEETYDWDVSEWDYHYLWCCCAIAQGVAQYDWAKGWRS